MSQPVKMDAREAVSSPRVFQDGKPLPKLLVFDIDYTLWPLWVDTHVSPPFKALPGNTGAKDRYGFTINFYRDVPSVLQSAHSLNIPMALASRTHSPKDAEKLFKMIHIPPLPAGSEPSTKAPIKAWDFFKYREIYPGDKKTHMRNINQASNISYEDMIFFDDESRNANVRSLGVHFHLVNSGVTVDEVDKAVEAWRRERENLS